MSFAVSLLMSKQLVQVGIPTKDLYLRTAAPHNLFIKFIHRCEAWPDSSLRECAKSFRRSIPGWWIGLANVPNRYVFRQYEPVCFLAKNLRTSSKVYVRLVDVDP